MSVISKLPHIYLLICHIGHSFNVKCLFKLLSSCWNNFTNDNAPRIAVETANNRCSHVATAKEVNTFLSLNHFAEIIVLVGPENDSRTQSACACHSFSFAPLPAVIGFELTRCFLQTTSPRVYATLASEDLRIFQIPRRKRFFQRLHEPVDYELHETNFSAR